MIFDFVIDEFVDECEFEFDEFIMDVLFMIIDMYIEGELICIVVDGIDCLVFVGDFVWECCDLFVDIYDWVCDLLMWEFCGYDDMFGVVVVDFDYFDVDVGVFFMDS